MTPEQKARVSIDALLAATGWHVCNVSSANLHATTGVAIRVSRARLDVVSAKYLNLALSYYPFIPLTTGSTSRRKLTKAALMTAPISVPSLRKQAEVIDEVERCLSIDREVETEADTNLKSAQALWQATLQKAFQS